LKSRCHIQGEQKVPASDLGYDCQDYVKIILNFLKRNSNFLLHILIINLENFSKYYSEVFLMGTFQIIWGLKVTVPPVLELPNEYCVEVGSDLYNDI